MFGFRFARARCGQTAPSDLSRLKPQRDVRASHHDGGLVLLHVRRGIVFSSNHVGATIWKGLLEEGFTVERIARSISCNFQVPTETAQADTRAFLIQLEAAGLLVRSAN